MFFDIEGIEDIDLITFNDVKVWLTEECNDDSFRTFISNFINESLDGDVIYNQRNLLIHYRISKNYGIDRDIVVKKFNLNRNYDKIRYRFIQSKALRSLKIALAFNKIGINTPKPIAVIEKRGKYRALLDSYYITEYIDYDYNLLDIISNNNHPLRGKVIYFLPQIAREIRKIHDAGIVHNDLHAGNILIKNIDNKPIYYFIDLNRARIKKNINNKQRMKDLSRLELRTDEQKVFLKNYTPQNYKNLLQLMINEQERHLKFIYKKKKIRQLFKVAK